jgi:DNA-binding transcriptional MerR regulator
MDNESYISPNKITKQYDITSGTLRRWSEAGKIRCLRPNGGKRIYNIEDIKKIFNKDNKMEEKNTNQKLIEKELPDNLKTIFDNLKKNISNNNDTESIDYIKSEIDVLTTLINHLKETKKIIKTM